MAPLSRQETKNQNQAISQFYTAVCVDGFVWVHKYTPRKRVLCFGGFQNRATTLSILSRRPHPPITFAGFPPAFHLKTVFHKYLKSSKLFLQMTSKRIYSRDACLVKKVYIYWMNFSEYPSKVRRCQTITQSLTITQPLTPWNGKSPKDGASCLETKR